RRACHSRRSLRCVPGGQHVVGRVAMAVAVLEDFEVAGEVVEGLVRFWFLSARREGAGAAPVAEEEFRIPNSELRIGIISHVCILNSEFGIRNSPAPKTSLRNPTYTPHPSTRGMLPRPEVVRSAPNQTA